MCMYDMDAELDSELRYIKVLSWSAFVLAALLTGLVLSGCKC